MAGHLRVVAAMDSLYERAAADPAAGGDEFLAAWLEEVLGALPPPVDKELARQVRRAARLGGRLARYWADPERAPRRPADWRQAVDAALGSRGWEPSLEVARRGLEVEPSPALFEEVRRRWRQVHFAPWMEGVAYEEWAQSR
ncbi:MAG TPA: hypothetical protein VMX37_01625 [Acidimicrobiia bacterium]|nr:hypothetical protein [Acidimicrobiia bacterium]